LRKQLKSKMRYLNAPLCEKTLWKISKKLKRGKPKEKNKLISPSMDWYRLNTPAKWQELCHLAANGPQETYTDQYTHSKCLHEFGNN